MSKESDNRYYKMTPEKQRENKQDFCSTYHTMDGRLDCHSVHCPGGQTDIENEHKQLEQICQQPTYDNSWSASAPHPTSTDSRQDHWLHDIVPSTPSPDALIEPPPPPNRSIYPLQTYSGYGVTVVPYSAAWTEQFKQIRSHLCTLFATSTPPAAFTAIEHIGSTSVPGLAAKPNIDVLVTFPSRSALEAALEALEWEIPTSPPFTRYTRVPNGGGIQGRESLKLYVPEWSPHYYTTPERSVYLINEGPGNPAGRVQIKCYRDVRDTLSHAANRDLLEEYAQLKLELGRRVYDDAITYSRLKDDVIRKILRRAGWTEEEVDEKERLSERVWVADEPAY